MTWNIVPECVSTVMLCIIWVYSRKGNPIPTLKNRLFQACISVTFCAMTSNILSTFLIATLNPFTILPTWIVTLFYFLATPLMGMFYFFYTLANIFDSETARRRVYLLCGIPGFAYVAMVLLNPLTRNVFDISVSGGYTQGPLIMVTYLVFYLYCLACFVVVLLAGKRVAAPIRAILFAFPVIAAIVIVVQLIEPSIILSGSAATSALLLIYLFLQNKQISIDYLTGLPNRQEFLKMLELKLRRQTPFTIVVFSLKEFKTVNDTFGQHSGDGFLVAVSKFLSQEFTLRESQLYRYSGDEFAILIDDAERGQIGDMITRISARMQKPWGAGDCTCLLAGAVGTVRYPETAQEVERLINGIEYAVGQAKLHPPGERVCHCDAPLLEQVRRRRQIAALLEQQLACDGFDVYYQPIYAVGERGFSGAEALLRMNGTPLGNLSPAEFIPIAEESGLIVDITYLVLERVCRQVRRLMDLGVSFRGISVNFSALQFTQRDLIARISEIVRRSNIPFEKILIEITESTLAQNQAVIVDFISRMHAMGVRVALDDFGTGYSNLASVIDLSIDTVKLDKSLIWSAMRNDRFSTVVQMLTQAFDQLGLTVLAEGIETVEQSTFVKRCGCDLIQGFLYARPMPQAEFEDFLVKSAKNDTDACGQICENVE